MDDNDPLRIIFAEAMQRTESKYKADAEANGLTYTPLRPDEKEVLYQAGLVLWENNMPKSRDELEAMNVSARQTAEYRWKFTPDERKAINQRLGQMFTKAIDQN